MLPVVVLSVFLLAHVPCFSAAGQPEINECDILISERYCTGGTYQELGTLFEKCGKREDAKYTQFYCLKNSMDQYCVLINSYKFRIEEVCPKDSRSCSQECKEALIKTRHELGCCIPSFFNNSEVVDRDEQYRYALWALCEVEPMTQKCPPSGIIIPPTPVDPTCTEQVLLARQQSVVCRKKYVEDIRSKLSEKEGCENYKYPGMKECNANIRRVYCELVHMESNFTGGSHACTDTTTCAPNCAKVLRSISETSGCCFVDKYEEKGLEWLKPEFWSKCGATFPGRCKEYLNNDVPSVSLPGEL